MILNIIKEYDMIITVILLSILSAILTTRMISYRRQVKITCRRLAFMKENETNMRLSHDISFRELNELENSINELVDSMRENFRISRENENALKETITNLSHDIRTPLTSLDGYFQLLSEECSDEQKARYIDIIQGRISSLKEMLEELFTYTKLQNDSCEIAFAPIDFSKSVCSTAFSFYEEFRQRGIEPKADFTEERLRIYGSDEAMRHVLQNIIKNALVHGGETIELKLFSEMGNAVFVCRNYVSSAEEINISEVFTRFYKADSARTKSSSGLGLSIAKGMTEKMNGTISASISGNYFTIRVQFPLIR